MPSTGLVRTYRPSFIPRIHSSVAAGVVLLFAVSVAIAQQRSATDPHVSYRIEHEVCVFDVWSYFEQADIDGTAERADVLYFLTSLQGIVNRDKPRLYLFAALALFDVETRHYYDPDYQKKPVTELDQFWFKQFKRWGYLKGTPIRRLESLDKLIEHYRTEIDGLGLWEMEVPATVNAALMAAGCDDLVPVSKDLGGGRLYRWLEEHFPDLDVRLDLTGRFDGERPIRVNGKEVPTTGSAKNDVYRFVIEHYQKPGKLDPYYMWYNCDAAMWGELRNHYAVEDYGYLGDRNELQQNGMYNADYWVAKRAFFLDLLPWDDDRPNDEPDQPLGADLATWHSILHESYKQRDGKFGVCGGFVPWWIKYTSEVGDKHEPVATEWEFIALLTSYNMANDGDAAFGIANASFFMHLPHLTREQCLQAPPAKIPYDPEATYLAFFMLDYDGSAWLNQMVTSVYADKKRGRLPLNWAINPVLHQRVPHAFRYLMEHKTPNDIFGISDDGAGYISPLHLFERKGRIKSSGAPAYETFARRLYHRYGMDYSAFYISPRVTPEWTVMAARITPSGFGYTAGPQMLVDGTPATPLNSYHVGNIAPFKRDIARVFEHAAMAGRAQAEFRAYRCILMTPTMIVDTIEAQRRKHPDAPVHVVDAPNYFRLLKHKLQQPVSRAHRGAERVLAAPRSSRGLRPILCSDGDYRIVEESGDFAWELPKSRHAYLYFDVDDAFADSLERGVQVHVEWFDDGSGTLSLQYNGADTSGVHAGAYHEAAPIVQRQGSGTWKTVTWRLTDAAFRNAQNGGADLRLHSSGEPLKLRRVVLKRASGVD